MDRGIFRRLADKTGQANLTPSNGRPADKTSQMNLLPANGRPADKTGQANLLSARQVAQKLLMNLAFGKARTKEDQSPCVNSGRRWNKSGQDTFLTSAGWGRVGVFLVTLKPSAKRTPLRFASLCCNAQKTSLNDSQIWLVAWAVRLGDCKKPYI